MIMMINVYVCLALRAEITLEGNANKKKMMKRKNTL